jgi:hypothetical protein
MLENVQGHTIKYKVGDEWVAIPIGVISVYDTYRAYCVENNIEPVSETTYYETLGHLQSLVDSFSNSTESITVLANSLKPNEDGETVLPLSMGGTGTNCKDVYALVEYLNTYGLAHSNTVTDLQNLVDTQIACGTTTPDKADLPLTCKYFFQH